jgi:hypothetical protein
MPPPVARVAGRAPVGAAASQGLAARAVPRSARRLGLHARDRGRAAPVGAGRATGRAPFRRAALAAGRRPAGLLAERARRGAAGPAAGVRLRLRPAAGIGPAGSQERRRVLGRLPPRRVARGRSAGE